MHLKSLTRRNKSHRIASLSVPLLLIGAICVSLLSAPPAQATAGINPQINFQGRLLTGAGAVVPDGTYNLEFKLYTGGTGCVTSGSSPCGGTNVWTEDWVYGSGSPDNRVVVRNGYFSVQLGALSSLTSIDFNNDTLWTSINVGDTTTAATFAGASGDGEMLPFKRLTSSPYAFNAGKLGGLAATSFLQLAQGVQTDSSTANASLFINKTGITASIMDLQRGGADVLLVNNSGQALFRPTVDALTALQVQKAGTTTVVFTVDSTNARIGIGTGAPAYAVDAVGSVNASVSLKVATIDVCTSTGCIVDPTSAIQNQTAASQSASFKISGTGTLATSVLTPSLDVASAGTLSLGGTTANAITLGNTSSPITIGSQLIANLSIALPASITTTNSAKLQVTGTISSSNTTQIAGIQNQLNINPTGASVGTVYGLINIPTISGSALAIGNAYGTYTRLDTSAGYTGQITTGAGLVSGTPTIAGSNLITKYSGVQVDANANNSGNTTGTIDNYGVKVFANTASAGSGGTLNNYGAYLQLASAAGAGTTNNYGLYLTGNGGGSSAYSLYNNSTALSFFAADITSNGTISGLTSVISPLLDTASAVTLNVGTTNASSINFGKSASNITTTVNGLAVFKPTSGNDSATAFQVKNGTGNQILTVDTTGNTQIILGKPGGSGIAGKLLFNNATNANTAAIVSGVTSTSYQLTLPTALSGSAGDCLKDTTGAGVLGFASCGGASSSLQGSYNTSAGATPSIAVNTTNKAVTIQNSITSGIAAGNEYFGVRATGASDVVLGNSLFTVNSTGVGINIGGTGNPATSGDLSFGTGADRVINVITQATSNTAGQKLTVISATGNGTGAGGILALQGGTGGSGATGNGGGATLTGGTSGSTNGNGGDVTISGGAKTGSGTGGSVIVKPQASNDSTTAFQVQNASGTSFFTADSTNQRIITKDLNIGTASTVGSSGHIFSDGFETGDAGLWSAGTGGGGAKTYDTTTLRNGKYAAKFVTTSNGAYAEAAIPSNTSFFGREYFNVTSLGNPTILMNFSTSNTATGPNLYIYLGASGNLCYNWNSGASTACSATAPSTSAWHQLETKVIINSTSSTLQVWLDGTLVTSNSNAINLVTTASFGSTNLVSFAIGNNVSSSATVYYDDVVVDTVATGDSSSLNVADSLHVAGGSSFSGLALFRAAQMATNAFQIQDPAGSSLFIADTTLNKIGIGTATPGAKLNVAKTGNPSIANTFQVDTSFNNAGGSLQKAASINGSINHATGTTYTAVGLDVSLTDNTSIADTLQGANITLSDTGSGATTVRGLFVDTSGTTNSNASVTTALFKAANSTTAIQIQNSTGTSFFTADSTNQRVITKDLNVGTSSTIGTGATGHLFSDGFETGDASVWSGGTGGLGSKTYDDTILHNGKYAALLSPITDGAYIQTAITSNATVFGREYFRVNGLGNPTILMDLGTAAIGSGTHLYIYLGASGNLCYNWNSGASSACSATAPSTSAWHQLETKVIINSTSSTLQVWLDGTLVTSNSNAINLVTTASFGSTNLANFAIGNNVSSTAAVYYDDVVVDTVATGDSSSLNVSDSLHVSGSSSFGGQALFRAATDSTTAFQVQDAAGNSALAFDSTNSHLKVYENISSPVKFVDIYYDNATSSAIFAASSGTTQIGVAGGSGNISLQLTGAADQLLATKINTPGAAYSLSDFNFTRTITGAGNAVTGNVLKVEDLSTFTGGGSVASNVLYVNQNNTSATGNLILAQYGGGANDKFKVNTLGTVTIAASQSYTGAGALTLQSGAATALTVTANAASTWSTTTGNLTLQAGGANTVILKPGTNSATAVQVQNAAGTSMLAFDSSADIISIGVSDTTGTQLVLDTKTDAADPTGVNGGMYYNSNAGRFRCYENSAWADCLGYRHLITLSADSTSTASTACQTVTGASFAVTSGVSYRFHATIIHTGSATTIGVGYGASGPATTLFSLSSLSTLSTGLIGGAGNSATSTCTNTTASSIATTGTVDTVDGIMIPSASGTFQLEFAPETATAGGVVIKAGSTLEWW